MNIKKFVLILIFFSLANCGFQPMYSQKDRVNFQIKGIELIGDKHVNRKIIDMASLKKNEKNDGLYGLILNSTKVVEIVSKNKKSNATNYRTTISVELSLNDENKIIKKKTFSNSFTYNNNSNKFELAQYQKNIEKNLTNKIAEEIIVFLNY